MHLDLDAFFAAVEQRDKPSLRGKPVVVGGVGPRGVVSTASYEARKFGIRSAMSTAEARSRCPSAAFLSGRFGAYREASAIVMTVLHELSPAVEPLSLDEAFVDLALNPDYNEASATRIAESVSTRITELTGGLTASIGIGSSKLVAKIASDLDKPHGIRVVPAGTEADFLADLPIRAIPGVGPVTNAKLGQYGLVTIADLRERSVSELATYIGANQAASLSRFSRGIDYRPVTAEREAKSISMEDTFEHDINDRNHLIAIADSQARKVAGRLVKYESSARTVSIKIRFNDFETLTRSATLAGPTDDPGVISRTARTLLSRIDLRSGVRLFGVGVSGLSDWVQEELFDDDVDPIIETLPAEPKRARIWRPGMDVEHKEHGAGWVWGAGLHRVTVRFETATTPPGPILTFMDDDPDLMAR